MTAHDELTAAWTEWQQATLIQRWRKANPGEAARLDSYRNTGGTPPVMATATGRALVHETAAWHATAPPPPPPVGEPTWETKVAALPDPLDSFVPQRTVHCTTAAQFTAAWNDLRPGDHLDARGITFPTGQLNLINKHLAGKALIDLTDSITPGGPNRNAGVWVSNTSNLILRGGNITTPTGTGILLFDNWDLDWRDFVVERAATGGVFSTATARHVERNTVVGTVIDCGWDNQWDPHQEKGTGTHPVYVGALADETSGLRHTSCVYGLDVQTARNGSAVQAGPAIHNTRFIIRARDLRFAATIQVAGNGWQPFGDIQNCTVDHLEVTDAQGRAVEHNLYSSSHGNRVLHGRAVNTNLNPRLDDQPYPPHPAITYEDCR